MTAREYAKKCGVVITGKLTRKTGTDIKYDPVTDTMKEEKFAYWMDEAGIEIGKGKNGGWYIILPDGGVL